MAYIGDWKAIMQSGGNGGKEIKGWLAWVTWRAAYLNMSVSWRNKCLIPVYWVLNWLFGRDITRF
jgi:NADH dehydrogenase